MLIYRIEHEESGIGPYNHYVGKARWVEYVRLEEKLASTHPAISEDMYSFRSGEMLCGFVTPDQLYAWFSVVPNAFEIMQEHGFVVAEHNVPALRVFNTLSGTQVAFKPGVSKVCYQISEWFDRVMS